IYKRMQYSVKADFLFKISNKLFLGPTMSFDYSEGKDFNHPEYIEGMDRVVISTSVGLSFMYDTRDVLTAPYKGIYLKVEQRFFPPFSNTENFSSTDVIFDFYQKIWKGGVLAFDFHTQMNYGNVPWTMMARMGGSYRMRGYYEGRYRDNNIVEGQIELRQHIWRRNSLVLWVGAGNVFKDLDNFNINHTLPNFGVGYRWEFKKRVNVRLDFGIGKGQTGFIFNINEAF
ncbi:MAG: BamA/TamA family outer membrane protein, partial [Flavobacteriales bacterium]|nr:BamA/TamA family outer membrane protein [Flavobacteriales bacterium]